jgi:STE24 endopeptidase
VLLIMAVEFALISPLFMLIANAVSRKAEYRADEQAVKEGYAEQLVSALKKLARQNFSDLSPHPALVLLEYSHPTLAQRVEAIEKLSGENNK